ncbi:MAG: hypothetical protein ABIZ70_04855 [Gemmatimonadales bacterium]
MTDSPHVSPNPFGDAAPKEDRVGLAANAMAAGMAIAIAAIAVVAWATTRAAANSGITSKETITNGFAVNLVIYGTLGSIFLSGIVAWLLMATVDSNYRRGGLSMVSAFAGFLLSVILTMLVRGVFGVAALPALAALAALVGVFFIRRARAAV